MVSEIKKGDNNVMPPLNIWHDGGFRLELVNKSFQQLTGLKPLELQDWNKKIFQVTIQ
jgi:hypothetical protein